MLLVRKNEVMVDVPIRVVKVRRERVMNMTRNIGKSIGCRGWKGSEKGSDQAVG